MKGLSERWLTCLVGAMFVYLFLRTLLSRRHPDEQLVSQMKWTTPTDHREYWLCEEVDKSRLDHSLWKETSLVDNGVVKMASMNSARSASYGVHPYSAYVDEREVLAGDRYVRIIALAKAMTVAHFEAHSFFCHFWLEGWTKPLSVAAEAESVWPYYGRYHGALLSCRIPKRVSTSEGEVSGELTPMQVSVVDGPCGRPGHILPVQRSSGKRDKGVAVCAKVIYGSPDAVRLVEWIELNRLLGADMIYLYNASLTGRAVNDVLAAYHREGIVFLKPHDFLQYFSRKKLHSDFPTKDYNQNWELEILSMNDCLYLAEQRYVVNIDIDEILQPIHYDTFGEFIEREFATRGAYATMAKFKTAVFTDEFGPDKASIAEDYLHTMRYRLRTRPDYESPKSIVDFRLCRAVGHHVCLKGLAGNSTWNVPVEQGYVRHYRKTCRLTGEANKCEKLMRNPVQDLELERYKSDLQRRVLRRLKMFGLEVS